MFSQLIEPEVTSKLSAMKGHLEFLQEMSCSLTDTFDLGHIETKRRTEFQVEVEYGKNGNHYSRTRNLRFKVTPDGVRFHTFIWSHHLERLDLEEVYERGNDETRGTYSLKGIPPGFVTITTSPNSACGNSYGFSFELSRSDAELQPKLKFIIKLLKANGFTTAL